MRDEVGEKYLDLRCDSKVHNEVQIGKPVSIKLTHSIIHLILLALGRREALSIEVTSLVALKKILVQKL